MLTWLTCKAGCKIAKESLQSENKMRVIWKRFSNSYLHRAEIVRNIACGNEPLAKYLVNIFVRDWAQPASHPRTKSSFVLSLAK